MWKDRGPGVKILWLWAIGTAGSIPFLLLHFLRFTFFPKTSVSSSFFAVLVTSVVRTRLRDMEQFMNVQQQTPGLIDSPAIRDNDDHQSLNSEDFNREEKG
ncbi:hypothetical protein H5410_022763 [Solanum commersonii]|uniref:Uncharacterized protein n=1 Tax=Solanum commersonii TaxID=4109 RepID=A0A9J5ZFN5_SOLCO|nr:hypothetical protein H5410_022763 [Solanum commersonii]